MVNLLINNDGIHSCLTANQTVNLSAGFHVIEVIYFQDGGSTCLSLEYESNSIIRQPVPFNTLLPITDNTDFDNDNVQDSFDNDSDDDGCFDALEGDGGFSYADIDSNGRLTATINGSGIPGGTLQADISSKNQGQVATACTTDSDGDGINNQEEFGNGSDFLNPCDPSQSF